MTKQDKNSADNKSPTNEVVINLYASADKIYPRSTFGFFTKWRWAMIWLTQIVYYGLPWLEWGQRQALLFDFYGELLTDHQKEIYEQFALEDLSLSEIAEMKGISRQGVHDLVKRCQKTLEGYEMKLHLVEKFLSVKEKVSKIDDTLAEWEREKNDPEEMVKRIRKIADAIIEEL